MTVSGDLYFHSPCFDGCASAALALEYLETQWGWQNVELMPVGYDIRSKWSTARLGPRAAVVDFLFHPQAVLWVDHHPTSFSIAKPDLLKSHQIYDPASLSCARLMYQLLEPTDLAKRFKSLVEAADEIDSADYRNCEEAIFGSTPGLKISRALELNGSKDLSRSVVRWLKNEPLEETGARPEVVGAWKRAQDMMKRGLDSVKSSARKIDGCIVEFDVEETEHTLVNRYSPFHVFPEARYSAGIVRRGRTAKITTMRNPWLDFRSAPLGEICRREGGGGGHQRVGSIRLEKSRAPQAPVLLEAVINGIRSWDSEHA